VVVGGGGGAAGGGGGAGAGEGRISGQMAATGRDKRRVGGMWVRGAGFEGVEHC